MSDGGGECGGSPAFFCVLFFASSSSSISHTRTPVHVWILPTRAHPKTQGYSYGPAKLVYAPAKVNYNPQKGPVYAPIGVDMAEPEGGAEDADRQ